MDSFARRRVQSCSQGRQISTSGTRYFAASCSEDYSRHRRTWCCLLMLKFLRKNSYFQLQSPLNAAARIYSIDKTKILSVPLFTCGHCIASPQPDRTSLQAWCSHLFQSILLRQWSNAWISSCDIVRSIHSWSGMWFWHSTTCVNTPTTATRPSTYTPVSNFITTATTASTHPRLAFVVQMEASIDFALAVHAGEEPRLQTAAQLLHSVNQELHARAWSQSVQKARAKQRQSVRQQHFCLPC